MSWHYVAVFDGSRFTIHENYPAYGYTADAVVPDGETLNELIETLERMLADVKTYDVINGGEE